MALDEQTRQRCFTAFRGITYFAYGVYALFALLFIALGGAAVKGLSHYSDVYKASIPSGLIVLGVFQLIIVVVGFVGTLKKKQGLVIAYLVLMCLLIVCEWGVGGGAYAMRSDLDDKLTGVWEKMDDKDKNGVQADFLCCGWLDMEDAGSNCANNTHPDWAETRCRKTIVDGFSKYLSTTGAIGITFATLQLIGVVAASVVLACVQQDEKYNKFSAM